MSPILDTFASASEHAAHASVMDQAHRTLIGLLTTAGQSHPEGKAGLESTLSDVLACAGAYFTAEEAWMAEVGFPQHHAHKERHDAFRREIERLARLGRSEAAIRRRLGGVLLDWFVLHVELDCAHYAEWMRGSRQ